MRTGRAITEASPQSGLIPATCSTIGAKELNFRVRNGNGWILFAMTAVIQKSEIRRQWTEYCPPPANHKNGSRLLSFFFDKKLDNHIVEQSVVKNNQKYG
jgi:hypothetical protein